LTGGIPKKLKKYKALRVWAKQLKVLH
jgi:hypothetical protein